MNRLLRLLLSTAIVLTEPNTRKKIQDQIEDRFDDLGDRASRSYDEVIDRLERAGRAIRGQDHAVVNLAGFLAGIGVGVGLGILFAPASGEHTRATIAGKVQNFEEGIRERVTRETRRATGTEGGAD
jgi:hypothetical protein